VAGGGLLWLGLLCGAEALKKLPRKPSGAEARRREAPEGRSGARLPREFLSAGATAKQPKKLQTAARHKRSPSKKRRILSSHVFRMIRGRFAGSGRSPTLVVPRPKEKS